VGPGRVWQEVGDHGYVRASLPFALVLRNQNCVHNGEMTFLFSNMKDPRVSQVRYQITQETCEYFKFNMWGQLSASYVPSKIAGADEVRKAAAAEMANRLPTKPFSALAADYPNSGLDLGNFMSGRKFPEDVTTYGLFINGVHYVGNCQTRYGMYTQKMRYLHIRSGPGACCSIRQAKFAPINSAHPVEASSSSFQQQPSLEFHSDRGVMLAHAPHVRSAAIAQLARRVVVKNRPSRLAF
jgi:hypothetical protein